MDAVASMLYLDYSKKPGEWLPNRHGGNENLEAIAFIRQFNEVVYRYHPAAMTIAEESTSWPMVSRPTYVGGLGFGFKWNMGWMHDVLDYMQHDPVHRKYHHNRLTFGLLYAWHENFVLPLSHDEVVHGKGSLHGKMPGDDWQKFAGLRALYGFMYGHPGKKHLFMGGEFGQTREWNHDASLDWHLLDQGPYHRGLQSLVRDLNRVYRAEPALHQVDFDPAGFQWMDCSDAEQSVVAFVRRARDPRDFVLVVCNFTPVPRRGYRVGVPAEGFYRELLNTDAAYYGGSNLGNAGGVRAEPRPWTGQPWSVTLTLPPLGVVMLKPGRGLIYSGACRRHVASTPAAQRVPSMPRDRVLAMILAGGKGLAPRAPHAGAQQALGSVRRAATASSTSSCRTSSTRGSSRSTSSSSTSRSR